MFKLEEYQKTIVSELQSIQNTLLQSPHSKDAITEIFKEQLKDLDFDRLVQKLNNCEINGYLFARILMLLLEEKDEFFYTLHEAESNEDFVAWITKLAMKHSDDLTLMHNQQQRPLDWSMVTSKFVLDIEPKLQTTIKRFDKTEYVLETNRASLIRFIDRLSTELSASVLTRETMSEYEEELVHNIISNLNHIITNSKESLWK